MTGYGDDSSVATDITEDGSVIFAVFAGGGLVRDKRGNIIRVCGVAGCQYKTGVTNNMKKHKAAKHGIDVIWFSCDQDGCDYKAKHAGTLKRHERDDVGRRIRVHWNTREAYDGTIDTFNVDNGRVHVAYDDGDEEWLNPLDKEISWEFLGPLEENAKPLSSASSLTEEVGINPDEIYTDSEALYHCDQDGCDYKAKQASNLKRHKQKWFMILTFDGTTAIKTAADYKAKTAGDLKQHKQMVHDIDVRWHHCDQDGCDYKAKKA
eukprot:CAMPEP_0182518698 /NCGR_PEP_ID=MMETSP1321-20130603/44709_1 /TAXON_ID=91990 /ORGANISM="Bolidomonas sp., Strain RCC1657" /LENGTH=263 /DNA_ID=CAMNT_0024726637 /DNA_START=1380 /DNA_END=2167 /DNA_ORIENTATION=+